MGQTGPPARGPRDPTGQSTTHGKAHEPGPGSPCSPEGWAAPGSCRGCGTRSPPTRLPGVSAEAEITVIANTADDLWIHGLKVCPDLDTVMYTLGDGIDLERGWGRREETWGVKEELAAYGVEPTWFGLGDRDIGTHLVRTQMLDAGYRALRGDRGAVPPLAARGAAAADDRRPGRDARGDRRPRVAERPPGRALPGVLGAAARRGARRGRGVRRPRRVRARAGSHRRDHRRRPGDPAAVEPGRLRRHHPRRPPGARGAGRRPRRRSWASPPSSAAPTCAGWPSRC